MLESNFVRGKGGHRNTLSDLKEELWNLNIDEEYQNDTDLTVVQQLSQPVKLFQDCLHDLFIFKDNNLSAYNQAADLAELIKDNRPKVTNKALDLVLKLSSDKATRSGICANKKLVQNLFEIFYSDRDERICEIIQNLSKEKNALLAIRELITLAELFKLLNSSSEDVILTSLMIIKNLVSLQPVQVKAEIRDFSGYLDIAGLLSYRQDHLKDKLIHQLSLEILTMLAYEHQPTKLALLKTNLHKDVLTILNSSHDERNLCRSSARLIQVLTVSLEHKVAFVEKNAVQILGSHINPEDSDLTLEILWALRNISDQGYQLINIKEVLHKLVKLMNQSENHNIVTCVAGCLCNFTCQNPQNKTTLIELDGAQYLAEALKKKSDQDEFSEPACSALRHITHMNEKSDVAVHQIKNSNGVPTILDLVRKSNFKESLPLLKAVMGLIKNLSNDLDCLDEIRNLNGGQALGNVLLQTHESQETAEMLGVDFEDMLELTLTTLQSLSRDRKIREQLIMHNKLIPISIQSLYHNSIYIQRAAVGLLAELSTSTRGVTLIEKEGAIPKLTEMIQMNNEGVATFAANIVHRSANNKPIEYRRRLSNELKQSLFDAGILGQEDIKNADLNKEQSDLEMGHQSTFNTLKSMDQSSDKIATTKIKQNYI